MFLLDNPQELLFRIPALLLAITFHEYAHARVADYLGDPTPGYHGRLTLNPLKHLDPIGTLMLWIARFGWAKPVPINPMNFRGDRKRGIIMVSLAGVVTNLILAFIAMVLLRFQWMYFLNEHLVRITIVTIQLNLILAVFNMVPIPPLDGSKVLAGFLPHKYDYIFAQLEQYGPILLIILIFSGGIRSVLLPTVDFFFVFLQNIVFFSI